MQMTDGVAHLRGSSPRSPTPRVTTSRIRSEEHTSELQSHHDLVCRLLLEKKKKKTKQINPTTYTQTSFKNSLILTSTPLTSPADLLLAMTFFFPCKPRLITPLFRSTPYTI